MKIIQILNSPNWSAASAYCINVSYELIRLGHQVLLMTEPGYPLEQAQKLGILCDSKLRLNEHSLFSYINSLKHLKKTIKSFKPDIVSAHMNECSWMPGFVAKIVYPKAIVARVRTDIAAPNKNIFNLLVNHKWTDHIICGSELHKKVCCNNLFLSPDKISVIYGCVDANRFSPLNNASEVRQKLNLSDKDFVVCLLGRLSPIKGHEYALKAISLLNDIPNIKLLCIGYEAERTLEWLKNEAKRLNISNKLLYIAQCDNLPEVLNAIDVGIITSLGSEANSRATLEYMACGKPVVVSDVGVLPELVSEGKNGFVVNRANPTQLASSLRKFALDKGLCSEMGKFSRKIIENNFTLEHFGKKMEAVYMSLLNSSNK